MFIGTALAFQILMKSDRGGSEVISADKISFHKEWISLPPSYAEVQHWCDVTSSQIQKQSTPAWSSYPTLSPNAEWNRLFQSGVESTTAQKKGDQQDYSEIKAMRSKGIGNGQTKSHLKAPKNINVSDVDVSQVRMGELFYVVTLYKSTCLQPI